MAAEQDPKPDPLPPLAPDELPPAPRITTWPKKLGIVAIVFGVLGILRGVSAAFAVPKVVQELSAKPAFKQFMSNSIVQTWAKLGLTSSIALGVLGVVLLVCGIGLLLHYRWAVKGMLTWAGLKILLAIVVDVLEYVIYAKIRLAISEGALEPDAVPSLFRSWSISLVAVIFIIDCGLAIITLIWLTRGEVREETADWR